MRWPASSASRSRATANLTPPGSVLSGRPGRAPTAKACPSPTLSASPISPRPFRSTHSPPGVPGRRLSSTAGSLPIRLDATSGVVRAKIVTAPSATSPSTGLSSPFLADFAVVVLIPAVLAAKQQEWGLSIPRKSTYYDGASGERGAAASSSLSEQLFDFDAAHAIRTDLAGLGVSPLDLCLGVLPVAQLALNLFFARHWHRKPSTSALKDPAATAVGTNVDVGLYHAIAEVMHNENDSLVSGAAETHAVVRGALGCPGLSIPSSRPAAEPKTTRASTVVHAVSPLSRTSTAYSAASSPSPLPTTRPPLCPASCPLLPTATPASPSAMALHRPSSPRRPRRPFSLPPLRPPSLAPPERGASRARRAWPQSPPQPQARLLSCSSAFCHRLRHPGLGHPCHGCVCQDTTGPFALNDGRLSVCPTCPIEYCGMCRAPDL